MLSCSVWFSAPSMWMGGGPESRHVGRVSGLDGAVRLRPSIYKLGAENHMLNLTSSDPDDGSVRPKHVALRKLQ